jgi:CRP-like cAMP-binding protein
MAGEAGPRWPRYNASTMAVRDKLWYLERMDLFGHLEKQDIEKLARLAVHSNVKKRTPLYLPGDPADKVYLLKRGVVKISYLSEAGKEVTLAFLHPGDVFGELAVVDGSPRDHLAEVHEDATLCTFSRADFMSVMSAYPDIAFRITKLIGLRLRKLGNRVEKLLFKSAHARLAQTLLELSQEHGVQDAEGTLLTLKLSQRELGNLVGLSRESVNLCLADFKRQGLVAAQGRSLRLLDKAGLAAVH